jgi:hypothetical protein
MAGAPSPLSMFPVAGAKFFVSSLPFAEQSADVTIASFSGVTWIEVLKWTQMGSYGDTSQLITADLIGETRTKKLKGTKNAGSMANVFAATPSDAGQAKLVAAAADDDNYAFKIELTDKGTGVGATNSLREFYGLVMSASEAGGGANTVQTLNVTVEINSNIAVQAATNGT